MRNRLILQAEVAEEGPEEDGGGQEVEGGGGGQKVAEAGTEGLEYGGEVEEVEGDGGVGAEGFGGVAVEERHEGCLAAAAGAFPACQLAEDAAGHEPCRGVEAVPEGNQGRGSQEDCRGLGVSVCGGVSHQFAMSIIPK